MRPPRRSAIVMSRLPRLIDPRAPWLGMLRAALRRVRERGDSLVVADGTAGCEFVRRGAERLSIPTELVAVDDAATVEPGASGEPPVPARDRALLAAADCILALGIRANGNVHRGLRECLAEGRQVELAECEGLQSRAVRDELLALGATGWAPPEDSKLPLEVPDRTDSPCTRADAVYEIVPFPAQGDWGFLSHTTRACPGPWPGQAPVDYVDALLDDRPDADHSAIAALERILIERRLAASPRTIRGGHAAVCLTAVPLLTLPGLHQFRTHRSRWDFEPFGICIDRQWLQERGTRAVIYGEESTWINLPEADRPYFQLTHPAGAATRSRPLIDWSLEREWRHVGDLPLGDLPAERGLVFVPTYQAARRLAGVSRWPITLWPDPAIADFPPR